MAEFSDARYDARVRRQASALAEDGWDVTLVMYREDIERRRVRADAGVTLVEFPLSDRYASRRSWRDLWRRARMLRTLLAMWWEVLRRPAQVYWSHNFLLALPLWLAAATRRARLVYDAHELSWEGPELHFRLGVWLEAVLLRRAALTLCPSEDRARLIAEHYGVPAPLAIGNYPDFAPPGRSDRIRAELGIPPGTAILYYSGAFSLDTRLQEQVVAALPLLRNRAVFVLVGTCHPSERDRLQRMAARGGVAERVRILPPRPHAELLAYTASADVGICLLADAGLAYRYHALNKFYEYAACGLPVLASDLPTFRAEVLGPDGPIGAVCVPDDPREVARTLDSLLDDRRALSAMGERARASAASRWTWEAEARRLRAAAAALRPPTSAPVEKRRVTA